MGVIEVHLDISRYVPDIDVHANGINGTNGDGNQTNLLIDEQI